MSANTKTTNREIILKATKEILENYPKGIRYADLVKNISAKLPDIKVNTIHGSLWDIIQKVDNGEIKDIAKPEKGLYILQKYLKENEHEGQEYSVKEKKDTIKEKEFYKLFANYLENELDECTKTITLGGNIFHDKWGTPDVIGIYKILTRGIPQTPIEVISAEIKMNTSQLITAFGQACSYKLFSHKVYLVIPNNSPQGDIKRIESLCLTFGIGLILFDKTNIDNPNFEIKTRSIKSDPDYFYLNKYLKLMGENIINKLF